ncbi:Uncharacterised protein [Salmonella enterica subsp. enterica serovar Bovismorbificans]|nr:Uncharacterised protein [Salmonella enterica subsp. enterica serovar Bovismorbificans]CNU76079.1 Uncharacterised protein [Salmonella enterica subsp. enterica serovar Bovismorbificans]CNU84155.1 Uncharacterised protein [Salmonella enterica subsp. enterica serovar Bovismorbificans]
MSVIPLAAADIQNRRGRLIQPLAQQVNHGIAQRLIMARIKKRSPRLHHFGAVARIARTFMLYRQQIDVALFRHIKLMALWTYNAVINLRKRLMAKRTGKRHDNSGLGR